MQPRRGHHGAALIDTVGQIATCKSKIPNVKTTSAGFFRCVFHGVVIGPQSVVLHRVAHDTVYVPYLLETFGDIPSV